MSIKVAVRSRPMSGDELKENAEVIVHMNGNTVEVKESIDGYGGVFVYDHALWSSGPVADDAVNPEATQEHVYNAIGAELLEHVVTGYNGCVFAYGQTGSGKTHCMMGSDADPGLIPRIAANLFERSVALTEQKVEVCVEVSYYEVYNEKVRCLLRPTRGGYDDTPLRVREHPTFGPFIEGLARFVVTTQEEFLKLMRDGNKVRTTAATAMNATSSRSHAVFAITLTQKEQKGILVTQRTSRLNLVDLAGSERVSKTMATGKRLAEGANINTSLTCLGNVISALAEAEEKGKSRHIPYRDSILTWILKDHLGGNSKTVMLATVSPSSLQYEETMGTLRYAERAKRIVNRAVVNETNNNELVATLQKEIFSLKMQLENASTNERERLQEEIDANEAMKKELTTSLEEKLRHTKKLMEEREAYMHELESRLNAQSAEIDKLRNANDEKERRIHELLQRIQQLMPMSGAIDLEKVDLMREQVAALEQEQNATEVQLKERWQQTRTLVEHGGLQTERSMVAAAEIENTTERIAPQNSTSLMVVPRPAVDATSAAEHSGLPPAVRSATWKSRSASIVLFDTRSGATPTIRAEVAATSPNESADEDLVLDEEVSSEKADSDLDVLLAEDSDLVLPDAGDSLKGSVEMDFLADSDIRLGESVVVPTQPQSSSRISPGVSATITAAESSPRDGGPSSTAAVLSAVVETEPLLVAPLVDELAVSKVSSHVDPMRPLPMVGFVSSPVHSPRCVDGDRRDDSVLSASPAASFNDMQVALKDFFTKLSERPEIYAPNTNTAKLLIPSHALPKNRHLLESFRVVKCIGPANTEQPTSLVWDIDMLHGRIRVSHPAGAEAFYLKLTDLFRVEKDRRRSRRLALYFFDAKQPYELEFVSTVRRQHFFELAMLMRLHSILWCPSLCLDGENDVIITVKGTTIDRPGSPSLSVDGEVKMAVARMPYEVIDLWCGCFSMNGGPLPRHTAVFGGFFPKEQREVYVIGILDVPTSLMGSDELGRYFLALLGSSTYFLLSNTALASKKHRTNNCLVVLCRRSFIVRVANIESLETVSLRKEGVRRGDFTACGCSLSINESSMGIMLINARPGPYSSQTRAACIRTLLSYFPLADPSVDISVRFDYLIVAGAFHFGGDFSAGDALIHEILSDNLMSNMREMQPSAPLGDTPSPLRIFYSVRPSVSRMDLTTYSTSRALGLPNSFFSADIFFQRSFLSIFGERVPRVQVLLEHVTISGARFPLLSGAELQICMDAAEGSPTTFHLTACDGDYVIPPPSHATVYPCVSNFEYLHLQTVTFSVLGNVGPAAAHKRIVVASGVFALKSVALAEPALLHIPLYYRGCTVGKLTAVLTETYYERNSAELGALGFPNIRYATVVSCYENEVRRVSGEWVAACLVRDGALPFSAADPAEEQDRDTFALPTADSWRWLTEWLPDNREDDPQGWMYARDFESDLQLRPEAQTKVRRRRWVRIMQASGPIAYHSYVASNWNNPSHLVGAPPRKELFRNLL